MSSPAELKRLLDAAYGMEESAEVNCEKLLKSLAINGFASSIEHIRSDEVEHMKWVRQLQGFLK